MQTEVPQNQGFIRMSEFLTLKPCGPVERSFDRPNRQDISSALGANILHTSKHLILNCCETLHTTPAGMLVAAIDGHHLANQYLELVSGCTLLLSVEAINHALYCLDGVEIDEPKSKFHPAWERFYRQRLRDEAANPALPPASVVIARGITVFPDSSLEAGNTGVAVAYEDNPNIFAYQEDGYVPFYSIQHLEELLAISVEAAQEFAHDLLDGLNGYFDLPEAIVASQFLGRKGMQRRYASLFGKIMCGFQFDADNTRTLIESNIKTNIGEIVGFGLQQLSGEYSEADFDWQDKNQIWLQ